MGAGVAGGGGVGGGGGRKGACQGEEGNERVDDAGVVARCRREESYCH